MPLTRIKSKLREGFMSFDSGEGSQSSLNTESRRLIDVARSM